MAEQIDTSGAEFQNALNLITHTHQSLFLTGKAGTGKSTFLRYVCQHTKKKHVVLAPTGIAAINAGGQTLHSFFKLPFYPLVPDDARTAGRRIKQFLKYNKAHIKLLRELDLIIIDEISMVRADIIDFIDRILRTYTGRQRIPFGGIQMLLVGDVYQLEPVVKADERDILSRFYPNPYFFNARVFREMELVSIELSKVYRQKDPVFIRLLDHVRTGSISEGELKLLNLRHEAEAERPLPSPPAADSVVSTLGIVLATRRDTVDYINQTHLDAIQSSPTRFYGKVQGDFPDSMLPTQMELELKCGAQIIFIKNDPSKRWVNGTLGIITEMDEEAQELTVITDKGQEVRVEREIWENMRYTYNEKEKKIEEEQLGVFTQMPVRLAWAITIHKSQGLTFDQVSIDLGGGSFAGGQTYVALSRCRSLEGMTLRQPIQASDVFVRPEIAQFATSYNDERAMQRALKAAQADIAYAAAIRAFDQARIPEALDHFFLAIHARYDIEQPLQRRFLQRKLGIVRRLHEENLRLQHEMQQQQLRLQTYAQEYYELGNLSITEFHNIKAALKNYDKALDLYPNYLDAWIRKGITLMDDALYPEALHCLLRATQLSPTSFKAWYNLGRLHMERNDFDSALNALDHATSLRSDHPKAYHLLGDCFARMGDEERAELNWAIAEQLQKKQKGKHPPHK